MSEAVASFKEERARLVGGALRGREFCAAYARLVDRFLVGLLGQETAVALVAVGGYGRGELCPGSDVDVVLLHARRDRNDLARLADRLWYPLWDTGLKVGHAVRTVKEAVSLAATDLDTATALLDARLVAGEAALADDVVRRASAQWRSHSTRRLLTLADSVESRHQRAGEVAFLLEPDLKEGRGGLRDVHALRWAEAAARILLPGDHEALAGAYDVLLSARVELQRRTGSAADQLLLQEQDAVASALGDADADALMVRVANAARTVAWTSDETWDRIRSSLRGPSGRVAARDRPVSAGLVIREGLVELDASAAPDRDRSLTLRAAAAAAQAGTRIGRSSLDRLAAWAPPLEGPWPEEARRALVQLLASGKAGVTVLEALDQKGLLVRMLPEWGAVRSQPQRNAYHRYTVDRHLCEAAAEAASLTARVGRPDLLVLGAWFHDIGKGARSRDHSATGAELVRGVATRMGFPAQDVNVLVSLVANHLLLAETATRRDLDDAETVQHVARTVADVETLEVLHALTEADGLATGPAAWTPWKAGLVADLVARVRAVLSGAPPAPAAFPTPGQLALAERARAAGQLVVEGAGPTLTVAAPDRPGLFCRVAGTLTLHNLDVLAARAWSSEDGVAVEDFRVQPGFGREPDWTAVERDLGRVLAGELSLEARLADRARAYAGRPRAKAATPARTHVTVDNGASRTATVVEVRAPDRMGTLYRITRALADLELDIRHAKVATVGHEVVDVFYVVGASGAQVTDPDRMSELRRAVAFELSRV